MSGVRYAETAGAKVRAMFGIADTDVTVRARQLLDEEEIRHLSVYGTEPAPRVWPHEAGVSAAAAELGNPWISCTVADFEARARLADPLYKAAGNAGIGRTRTAADGTVEYSGDPEIVARMKAADDDRRRRRRG